MLGNLLKVIQLVSGVTRIRTQACIIPESSHNHHIIPGGSSFFSKSLKFSHLPGVGLSWILSLDSLS